MTTARSSSDVPADQRAIVIGASIAGLLAARVLSERYPDVLLLERDPLPEQAAPRKGTPQAVHPHGLLARGLQVMEELFPGFTDTLVARGALSGDIGLDVALDADRRRFARMSLGITGLAASRLAIEGELRRRVSALQGVHLMSPVNILTPVHEAGRIVAVTGAIQPTLPWTNRYCRQSWWSIARAEDHAALSGFANGVMTRRRSRR